MKTSLAMILAMLFALAACASDDQMSESKSDSSMTTAKSGPMAAPNYAFPGFAVYESDGRLWIFREGGKGQMEFVKDGEPSESVTMIGAGPNRMTIKSDDRETLLSYVSTKPGFRVFVHDDRLWVFREVPVRFRWTRVGYWGGDWSPPAKG